ncbi:unnamed protein product [Closterium sp. NIES-64]|nr:unnamed protein product [Closterium sp. NIES-64]
MCTRLGNLAEQRRTEQAVGKLVTQVGRLAATHDEEGGLGTETLREVVSAVKKHMHLSRSLQSAVEGLAERVDAQAQLKGAEATPQEEKILAVLKALVAHLRAKEKAGLTDAVLQGQRRMEGVVGALVGEVRNKTAFLSLLRAVRAQTAIVAKLGTRIASLETRVLPPSALPAAALATGDATALAASAGGAGGAGGVGGAEASVLVAAVTETQTGMAVVVREVQRQSEAVAELQGMLEASRGADMLQLAHKTHEALHDLVLAVRQQGKLLVSLDARLAHIEGHVGGEGRGGAGPADGDVARLERAVAAEAEGGADVLQAAEEVIGGMAGAQAQGGEQPQEGQGEQQGGQGEQQEGQGEQQEGQGEQQEGQGEQQEGQGEQQEGQGEQQEGQGGQQEQQEQGQHEGQQSNNGDLAGEVVLVGAPHTS